MSFVRTVLNDLPLGDLGLTGKPTREVADDLGIRTELIARWKSHQKNGTYYLLQSLLPEFSKQITMGMDAARNNYWHSYCGQPGLTFLLKNFKKDLDKWGLPTLSIDMQFRENEMAMRKEMMTSRAEMLETSGFKNIQTYDDQSEPGLGIHEMGTARMGKNPKTSLLNRWNQLHLVPNFFL